MTAPQISVDFGTVTPPGREIAMPGMNSRAGKENLTDRKAMIRGRYADQRYDDTEALLANGTWALVVDGDLHTARHRFDMAYRLAERTCDATAMAAAALGLTGLWVHEHRAFADSALVRSRLVDALSLVDPQSSIALRLRVRLAAESDYRAGSYTDVMAGLDEARHSDDPVVLAEALSVAHHCLLGPDHAELRAALAAELVVASFRTSRRSDLMMGLLWQTINQLFVADPRADRTLGELRELLASADHGAIGFVVSAIDVMLAIREGRLDQAETIANACAERGRAAGDVDAAGWHVGQMLAIRWYQGRLAELLPMIDGLVSSATLSAVDHSFVAGLALVAAVAGDRRKAASALASLRGHDLADLPRSSSWLVTIGGVIETAHLLKDADLSKRAYELLTPFADLPMVGGLGVVCFGSIHHALGVASLTVDDATRAVGHFSTAVRQNLALGHWPAVVDSRMRLAQALARRARPEDAAAARLELSIATRDAAALGIATRTGGHHEAPTPALQCVREGRHWRMSLGHRSTVVEHNIGMFHLAVLIANAGREIAAVDLAAGLAGLSSAKAGASASGQPMLDDAAMREYRQRLNQLREEIEDLDAKGRVARADRARTERDWLLAELARATGIGGRTRRFSDDAERARIAVGKAIRRALRRVTETDALIGEHLRSTVHTGVRCYYRPDSR